MISKTKAAPATPEVAQAPAKATGIPAIDETLTQEQRDAPYRRRLSERLQAADKARFERIRRNAQYGPAGM